jgi:hypothetical protein
MLMRQTCNAFVAYTSEVAFLLSSCWKGLPLGAPLFTWISLLKPLHRYTTSSEVVSMAPLHTGWRRAERTNSIKYPVQVSQYPPCPISMWYCMFKFGLHVHAMAAWSTFPPDASPQVLRLDSLSNATHEQHYASTLLAMIVFEPNRGLLSYSSSWWGSLPSYKDFRNLLIFTTSVKSTHRHLSQERFATNTNSGGICGFLFPALNFSSDPRHFCNIAHHEITFG